MQWRLGLVGAVVLSACVPAPDGRVTPPGSGSPEPSNAPAAPSAAGPSVSPSFVRPTPNPSPTFLVYVVRAGDSLTAIARLFGTTARSIAFWNRAQYPSLDPDSVAYEPDRLQVGWTLLLIPTEVVDEDELPDLAPSPAPTSSPTAVPAAESPAPGPSARSS